VNASISTLIALAKYLTNSKKYPFTPTQLKQYDLIEDDALDMLDMLLMLRYLFAYDDAKWVGERQFTL
jgi:hypothetical protein